MCLSEMISEDYLVWRNTRDSLTKKITNVESLNNPRKQAKCVMMALYVINTGSGRYNHETIRSEGQVLKQNLTFKSIVH